MIQRVNVLGVLLGIAGLLVLLTVGLVLPDMDGVWQILTAEARADAAQADIDTGPGLVEPKTNVKNKPTKIDKELAQQKTVVHAFVGQHPTVDIIYLGSLEDGETIHRDCVFESEIVHESGRRERLSVVLRIGSLRQGVLVNKTPEAILVEGDKVNLKPIDTAPFITLEKCDPRLEE